MIDNSKKVCFEANLQLILKNLVMDSFGNASLRCNKSILIKASGVNLSESSYEDIVEVPLNSLPVNCNQNNPSTDTPTHLALYSAFASIGGVVHTHSLYASAWAQAVKAIPCLGTTHADYWKGDIPVTRELTVDEINGEYELETGKVIVETLRELRYEPLECPGIIVAHHGPFTWGSTVEKAVKNAERLEYIAKLAWMTLQMKPQILPISTELHHRHFSRKHGPDAYYGQGTT
jgi:L-ribulose-5-phosphate 4-epimerase